MAKTGIGETEDDGPKEMPRDTALEDVTAGNLDLRDADQGDFIDGNAAGSDPKKLGRKARLKDVATSTPLRRTQRLRKRAMEGFET